MRRMMTGITNPTEEYFKDGLWGWDGTQWRKAGLPLWYRVTYMENLGGTATGSSWEKYTSLVPSGYVYVIKAASIRNLTRVTGATQFLVLNNAGNYVQLAWVKSLDQYQPLMWGGDIIMSEGWKFGVIMAGTQTDDVVAGSVAGYKVAIT